MQFLETLLEKGLDVMEMATAVDEQTGTAAKWVLTEELGKQIATAEVSQKEIAANLTEPVVGFIHAVSWREPWLICLVVFHTSLLVLSIVSRKHSNMQMGIFFLAFLGVFSAERLNSFLQRHWKHFAYQPYFDSQGLFLSTVWSGPLLVVSSLILVNSLITFSTLVLKWKRAMQNHGAQAAQEKID